MGVWLWAFSRVWEICAPFRGELGPRGNIGKGRGEHREGDMGTLGREEGEYREGERGYREGKRGNTWKGRGNIGKGRGEHREGQRRVVLHKMYTCMYILPTSLQMFHRIQSSNLS